MVSDTIWMNLEPVLFILDTYRAMCNSYNDCYECPLGGECICALGDEIGNRTSDLQIIDTVLKWASENNAPYRKLTYKEDFLAKHPNCDMNASGEIVGACRRAIYDGYAQCTKAGISCEACWSEKMDGEVR